MIEIKITNPHEIPREQMEHLASYLLASIGGVLHIPGKELKNIPQSLENNSNKIEESPQSDPISLYNDAELQQKETLDSEGMPWNKELHTAGKTKNKNGTWKLKKSTLDKKVNDAFAAQDSNLNQEIAQSQDSLISVVENAKPVQETKSFSELMTLITRSVTSGQLKRDRINEIVSSFGVPSLALLPTMADKINPIYAQIEGFINHAAQ